MYPKIYLSIDNCFATKRWTKPAEWAEIVKECGLKYVESSADTECDMLYSDKEYLKRWRNETEKACGRYGLEIDCAYTGHGTYSTLGLTHTDKDCRERMLKEWMFPHIDNAANFGAVAGFYCHAFDDSVMQNPEEYGKYKKILYSQLERIAEYAEKKGVSPSLEQMYSPRQYPWRIKDGNDLVRELSETSPFRITIDTGHQTGQRLFLRPDDGKIREAIKDRTELYVGTDGAQSLLRKAKDGSISEDEAVAGINGIIQSTEYMFADEKDGSAEEWLKALGSCSPVIHLQQTDGLSSSHRDFSDESNANGIITGEKVLKSLYICYRNLPDGAQPAEKIYLTLELFYANTAYNCDIIRSIRSSVEYWRRFIPYDGIPLDYAAALAEGE